MANIAYSQTDSMANVVYSQTDSMVNVAYSQTDRMASRNSFIALRNRTKLSVNTITLADMM